MDNKKNQFKLGKPNNKVQFGIIFITNGSIFKVTLFLKPLIVIPVFLFFLSFYYANAADKTDKRLSKVF